MKARQVVAVAVATAASWFCQPPASAEGEFPAGFSSYEACMEAKNRLQSQRAAYAGAAWDALAKVGPGQITKQLWDMAAKIRDQMNAIKCFGSPEESTSRRNASLNTPLKIIDLARQVRVRYMDPRVADYMQQRISEVRVRSLRTLEDFDKTALDARSVGVGAGPAQAVPEPAPVPKPDPRYEVHDALETLETEQALAAEFEAAAQQLANPQVESKPRIRDARAKPDRPLRRARRRFDDDFDD